MFLSGGNWCYLVVLGTRWGWCNIGFRFGVLFWWVVLVFCLGIWVLVFGGFWVFGFEFGLVWVCGFGLGLGGFRVGVWVALLFWLGFWGGMFWRFWGLGWLVVGWFCGLD